MALLLNAGRLVCGWAVSVCLAWLNILEGREEESNATGLTCTCKKQLQESSDVPTHTNTQKYLRRVVQALL